MSATASPFRSIALVLNSYFGNFMMELAALLKARHGSQVHLYVKSEILARQYRDGTHAKLFASVTNFMVFPPALREPIADEAAELTEARDRERRLGVTYNTFAVTNRHVGRGYALGGFYHPGSGYGESSYLQMVHAYNVLLGFWEREFTHHQVGLVIADNKEIASVARMLGIQYRTMARARYKNFHYWEEREGRDADAIRRAYEHLPTTESGADQPAPLPAYVAGKSIIRRAMKRARLTTVVRQAVEIPVRHTYWRLRGYEKAKGYFVGEQIRMLFRQRRDILRMLGPRTTRLEDLEGIPFIYYPLHTEPEQSLGQISPEFFFQLAAIAMISRDLPAGWRLAVKDVPMGCGRRPDNFYDQILRLKNVDILNLAIPGPEVINRAAAVATIAGTGGLEAALLGKPVISFGRHNPYNFLPHVMVVRDLAEVPGYVSRIVNGEIDMARARADAQRYIAAIEAVSFDMGEFDYIDLSRYSAEAAEQAYRLLCDSVDEHYVAGPATSQAEISEVNA